MAEPLGRDSTGEPPATPCLRCSELEPDEGARLWLDEQGWRMLHHKCMTQAELEHLAKPSPQLN
jgi:hypothetical protein